MSTSIVTVDIGTTSVRALLWSADGRVLHTASRENPPAQLPDGRVEQDPASWQKIVPALLKDCAEQAAARGLRPACVAVTAQRSSVLAVDAEGQPLHPAIMWQDTRTAELARQFQVHDALVYRKTGLKVSPVFSAIKMTWLRRHRPELWRHTHKLPGVMDWVLWNLCGRWCTDHSLASRTNLLNLQQRDWDAELLALFEVPEALLCELVSPGSVVGGLTPAMAAATGLQAGLPVVTAGGDQQNAALGLGLFSAEQAVSNTGTGSYLIGHADQPVWDPQMRVQCNVSALPGACIVEAAVLTSGAIYRWFAQSVLGRQDDLQQVFEMLNAEAAAVPPGANGVMLLPHFRGSGSPHWDPQARGLFCNLGLGTTRGEMARAILEAIAIELKASLELIESLCGRVRCVHVSGGMSRSPLFNQIQADVFERRVQAFGGSEATSLGAWMSAAVATGLAASHAQAFALQAGARDAGGPDGHAALHCQPDVATAAVYRRARERSAAVYQAMAAPALRQLFTEPTGTP